MSETAFRSFQRDLEAIAAKDGAEARAHMKALAGRFPFLTGASKSSGPRIMTFRSLRHARLKANADGSIGLKIPEGHFSTRFFLNSIRARGITANVFGDNLGRQASGLPTDIGVNTISCPDLHAEDLTALSRYLALQTALPVINPPHLVLGTGRSDMAQTLQGISGLRVPRTVRLTVSEDGIAECVLAGFQAPIIFRMAGTHTGRTARLVRRRADLRAVLKGFPPGATLYATEFVDARGEQEMFTKLRAFFIDGSFYPVARLVSNTWSVHSGDRYRVMFALPDAQRLERAYLADPEGQLGSRAMRALEAVRDRVGLDFFGIDFAPMPSGDLLIFEANAVMRHNYDHAKTFAYTRPQLDRISAAFDEMVLRRTGQQRN